MLWTPRLLASASPCPPYQREYVFAAWPRAGFTRVPGVRRPAAPVPRVPGPGRACLGRGLSGALSPVSGGKP